MDTVTAAVAVVSIVVAELCALLGLWLRLRWRVQHADTQRQYLASAAAAVAGGGRLELDEQQDDGRQLRIRITRASAGTEDGEA